MTRRLAALVLPLFLLASCGGSGGTATISCREQYWDGSVGLCLPGGWNVVDRETLADRGVPDEVIVAFQTATAAAGQFPTVTVTRESLTEPLDSEDYSAASIKSVSTLPGYALVDTQNVVVDGNTVGMHIFTAQPLNDEPARRFYQVSAVEGGAGYTVTGLAPVSADATLDGELKLILDSLTFDEPAATEEAAS